MKPLILAAALIASPAISETVDVFVVLEDGSGVVQYQSDTALQEAAMMVGGDRPEGARGLVLQKDQPARWTNMAALDLNAFHGGDGVPAMANRTEATEVADATPDPDTGGTAAAPTTAGATATGRIAPKDGTWGVDIVEQTFTGCPSMVENAARAQMSAMDLSGEAGSIGPDFTPQKMAPQLNWTQRSANDWLGTLDMTTDGAGAVLEWGVTVISPELIENRQKLAFAIPGLGNCEVTTFVQAKWLN